MMEYAASAPSPYAGMFYMQQPMQQPHQQHSPLPQQQQQQQNATPTNNTSTTPPSVQPGASAGKKKILAKRFKTELCQSSLYGRRCPYEARCMFAHGPEELRTAEQNLADGLTSEEAIKEWKILNPPGSVLLRMAQQQQQQRAALIGAHAAAAAGGSWPTIPMAIMTTSGTAVPVRLPQAAPATPLPSFPGYTTVHPGQMVYVPSPDGQSLMPVPIASLCWPNGVPLLPLPSAPAAPAATLPQQAQPTPTLAQSSKLSADAPEHIPREAVHAYDVHKHFGGASVTTSYATARHQHESHSKQAQSPPPSPNAASPHGPIGGASYMIGGASLAQSNAPLNETSGPTLAASWDEFQAAMLGASFANSAPSAPPGGNSLFHLDSVLNEVRRRDKVTVEDTNT